MISIVIPLYNKEKQIANTLLTVFDQTFQNYEIVIVNDGSTDNSVDIVNSFNDDRIRLICQENQGVSAARNKGIEEAIYDYISFLDADDEWLPDYLETHVSLIRKYTECKVFACAYNFKRHNGETNPLILNKFPFLEEQGILSNYFEVASCSHPPLWTSAVIVRKDALTAIGGFPVGVKSGEDLLTWARLAVEYKIAYCKKTKAIFLLDESHNITSTPSRLHDEKDKIVDGLIQLLAQCKKSEKKHIRHYISLWYKMRASVYLRLSDKQNTLKYGWFALRYNYKNWKNLFFMVVVMLPKSLQYLIRKQYSK
jgi:Glycosyltransferases involved in cell wall biogenesis